MVTLKQIADLTNVSISTVSRVLSNKGNISEETKQKVFAAVEELIYQPGVVTQSARALSPSTIALLIPPKGEYYQDDPTSSIDLRSLIEEFQKNGDTTELLYQNTGNATGEELVRKWDNQEIQGVVIVDPPSRGALVENVIARGIPYLITNGHFRQAAYNFIDFNNYDGAGQITQHLLDMGHRDIAVIAGPENHMVSHNRLDGVRDTLAKAGLSLRPEAVTFQSFSLDGGYAGFQALHAQGCQCTAILALSDFIAMGAMKAMREHGLNIPDDISIVGFDNLRFADFCQPALTTVNRFSKEISYLIVKTLQDLIRFGEKIESVNVNLKTTLITRQSVKSLVKAG
jgi:DNA-binding LacI/PurR family transcriptional regulator